MRNLEERSLRHDEIYKERVLKFYLYIDELDDLKYLMHLFGFHLAPTICKIKAGSLVNLKNSKRDLINTWNVYKKYIADYFNLKFVELKKDEEKYLLYFYDETELIKRFENKDIASYLSFSGYEKNNNINYYISKLKENFKFSIPSEVGIFLDYPLLDVIDFEKNIKKCKYCGYWKCYNDVEGAKGICYRYDMLKMNYISKILNWHP